MRLKKNHIIICQSFYFWFDDLIYRSSLFDWFWITVGLSLETFLLMLIKVLLHSVYTFQMKLYWCVKFHCRYCLYPQDIVIQLENRSRLRKIQILSHQYLIGKSKLASLLNICCKILCLHAYLTLQFCRFVSNSENVECRIMHEQTFFSFNFIRYTCSFQKNKYLNFKTP